MEAIRWDGDHLLVLDQRKLPHQTRWLSLRTAGETAQAIRDMAVRGAPLQGIAAAYALALESRNLPADSAAALRKLEEIAAALRSMRPTAVHLGRAVDRMMRAAGQSFAANTSVFAALEREALEIHAEDRAVCREIARLGAGLLPDGFVLTHCNTGALAAGGEGTAYAVIKEGFRQSKVRGVWVCETRPYLQGARLTAYELLEDGIPFTLITDSMAGHFMSLKKVDAVIVGADRIAANGDTANKIGTYALAVLAKENGIPFYAAASFETVDFSLESGAKIPLEDRSAEEVLRIGETKIAPEGTPAAHPAFDITPARYITAVITEKGVLRPPYRESLACERTGAGLSVKHGSCRDTAPSWKK